MKFFGLTKIKKEIIKPKKDFIEILELAFSFTILDTEDVIILLRKELSDFVFVHGSGMKYAGFFKLFFVFIGLIAPTLKPCCSNFS